MYPLSDITAMHTLGKTTNLVIITVHFFQITSIFMTLLSPIIHNSDAIKRLKAEILSYPISTVIMKNKWYTEAKQKMSQILPLTKLLTWLSPIQYWMLLMVKEYFSGWDTNIWRGYHVSVEQWGTHSYLTVWSTSRRIGLPSMKLLRKDIQPKGRQ